MKDWNAGKYLKFQTERTQPARDLANRITQKKPRKILDVGCGPGNSTEVLYEKFSMSEIIGVDASMSMLQAARKRLPMLSFYKCNIETERSQITEQYDVIFSNACLQWIPNHEQVLKDLFRLVKNGGELCIQVPYNDKEPIKQIIDKVTKRDHWYPYFKERRANNTLQAMEYYDLMSMYASNIDLWSTTYFHEMKSHEDIISWYESTGLHPYLSVLDEKKQEHLKLELLEELRSVYPVMKNGMILFPFPRLFFVCHSL